MDRRGKPPLERTIEREQKAGRTGGADGNRIVYDESAIERLLDRSQLVLHPPTWVNYLHQQCSFLQPQYVSNSDDSTLCSCQRLSDNIESCQSLDCRGKLSKLMAGRRGSCSLKERAGALAACCLLRCAASFGIAGSACWPLFPLHTLRACHPPPSFARPGNDGT